MTVTFISKKAKKSGHTKATAPIIDILKPGRLRVANLMALFSVSHSTIYQGLKVGRYPKPDGYDGKFPYWHTETISGLPRIQ